jgi:type I restriction enzyme R subunit
MSEYTFVEKPFLDQLDALDWTVIDQGPGIPTDPTKSLRASFREVTLRDVFNQAVRAINTTADGRTWLTDKQLDDLHDALLSNSGRSLVENNEAVLKLLFRSQVDANELTGEQYPNVKLIDFEHPERNQFHAINQFRIDTPGTTKDFIVPDIVQFVNGLPLVVVECKEANAFTSNPMFEAFQQLMRYSDQHVLLALADLDSGIDVPFIILAKKRWHTDGSSSVQTRKRRFEFPLMIETMRII